MTLTIKAEGTAGSHLRDDIMPDMLELARRTGCRVEVQANETTLWAMPDDSIAELKAAFDRLYPDSRIIGVGLGRPVPRRPMPPSSGDA